jgi:hypothetical protein
MSIGIPTSVLRSMAADSATAAFHIAGVRHYDIPQTITDARSALAELDAIDRSSLPPSLPSTDPKKLRADLTKIASAARAQLDLLEAAREARPLLISRSVQATRAATAGWATALATEWDTVWAEFVAVRPYAPIAVDQWTSEEGAGAHVKILRTVDALDRLLIDRVTLGAASGEDAPRAGSILFCIGIPPVPDDPTAVERRWEDLGGLLAKWTAGGPLLTTGTRQALTGRERWESLLMVDGIDIAMAPITGGIIDARMAQVDAWQNAIATLHTFGGLAKFNQMPRLDR